MARKIKWRLQFKSLNGTGCLVNIYEEGYTNSQADTTKTGADVPFAVETGVTELIGAAVPFEYQEDDSNNLLEVIRIKTAYMRVIEMNKHDLDDLFPTSIRHHFVEAFYGNERVFTGFMQCQEFDNAWVANPRELEFACVSPLGLLSAFKFNVNDAPGLVTLGSLMHEVMIGLNPSATANNASDYTDVITPAGDEYVPWNSVISAAVMSPFNPDFKHYDAVSKLYEPKDYQYFIEGICACFGWIVHDTPSSIVFAKYDHSGRYYAKLTVEGLASLDTGFEYIDISGVESFNSYYYNTDDDATKTVLPPLKELTLQMEGVTISKRELTTEHTVTSSRGEAVGGSNYRAISLKKACPDVDGDHIGEAWFNGNGEIIYNGLYPIAYAKIENGDTSFSFDEFWVIKYSSSWASGVNMITVNLGSMPPWGYEGLFLLKLKMSRGSSLESMQQSGYNTFWVSLTIQVDNYYYWIEQNKFINSPVRNTVKIDGATGKIEPNAALSGSLGAHHYKISDADGILMDLYQGTSWKMFDNVKIMIDVVNPSGGNGLNDGDYISITELSLVNPNTARAPYIDEYWSHESIVIGNNSTGTDEATLTVNINNYQNFRGDNSFGLQNQGPVASPPSFPYMFSPLHVLTERVKRTSAAINFNEYAAKWSYWINNWHWRMIAKTFNLRDDEYTMTLARSSTI